MRKVIVSFVWLLTVCAWAANSRDGSCAASATSCTFSATSTGDMKVVFAYANNTTTIPTLPAGWTTIDSGATAAGGVPAAFRVGCNVSSSSGDTGTGTWTNATQVSGTSYAGTAVGTTANCNFTGVGGTGKNNAKVSTTANFPVTGSAHSQIDGSSWVIGFLGTSAGSGCTPAGMTSVASNGAGPSIIANDTNGGVTTWASTNCTVTSGTWMTSTIEVMVATCKNTAYNNITCVQATVLNSPGACGTQTGAITVTNAGDLLFAYVDANAAITGASDNVNGSWTAQYTDNNWQGTSHDRFFTVIASTAASLNVTFTCPGSTNFEFSIVELHSSVGTVAVDCVGTLITGAQTNPSPTCSSPTRANDLGMSFIDWNNQPTAGSGWLAIAEQEENIVELKALSSSGMVTAPWTISDTLITGTLAFSDGSSSPVMAIFPKTTILPKTTVF